MGNWNRHFVRVGSDGNMGVYDQKGNRFIKESVGSDNLPNAIAFLFNSSDYPINNPDPYNAQFAFNSGSSNPALIGSGSQTFEIDGNPLIVGGNYGSYGPTIGAEYAPIKIFSLPNAMYGIASLAGSPDLRIGVTAADASPITIYSSTVSGTRYEVKARILATSGLSATYTISWTEGGVAQTVALTITAVDTEVHDNFVIAPDAGTDITAQITALTSSTVNVDAIVSVLG